MNPSHSSLDAAASERKARLAQLKSLKRKQSGNREATNSESTTSESTPFRSADIVQSNDNFPTSTTDLYLSGRNYDVETKGPKLGFENAPHAQAETLEARAEVLSKEAQQTEQQDMQEEKPIDVFSLQPKKPNWDLKRDLDKKLEVLNARTENAIARLVRERLESQKRRELEKDKDADDAEIVGIGGADLIQSMRMREKEEIERKKTGDDIQMA